MEIKKITDKAFQKYGAVIEGMDFSNRYTYRQPRLPTT